MDETKHEYYDSFSERNKVLEVVNKSDQFKEIDIDGWDNTLIIPK